MHLLWFWQMMIASISFRSPLKSAIILLSQWKLSLAGMLSWNSCLVISEIVSLFSCPLLPMVWCTTVM